MSQELTDTRDTLKKTTKGLKSTKEFYNNVTQHLCEVENKLAQSDSELNILRFHCRRKNPLMVYKVYPGIY